MMQGGGGDEGWAARNEARTYCGEEGLKMWWW